MILSLQNLGVILPMLTPLRHDSFTLNPFTLHPICGVISQVSLPAHTAHMCIPLWAVHQHVLFYSAGGVGMLMHIGKGRAFTKSIRSSSMMRLLMSITAPGASRSGQMLPMAACSCRVSLQGTRSCSIRFTSSYLPGIIMVRRNQCQKTELSSRTLLARVYTERI